MKGRALRAVLVLILGVILALQPAGAPGGSAASSCGARVAVLGANLTAAGRAEVERALGVNARTVLLTETLADEQSQARGAIPPYLLGQAAVSSVLLHLLPPGSGLTVTLNAPITDTAQTYANALLTAGVTDAEVRVAAPAALAANVYGTTALLGLFRASQVACHALNPIRVGLALQEVVLTTELAQAPGIGRTTAPRLLYALKNDAVSRHISTAQGLDALVAYDASRQNITVPATLLPSLATFLHGLVVSSAYTGVLQRKARITAATPLRLHVAIAAPTTAGGATPAAKGTARPSRGTPVSKGTPVPKRATPTPVASSRAGVWTGTVKFANASGVAVREKDGVHDYPAARGILVYRNHAQSSLLALQPGDAVTVTTNAAGDATDIIATGRTTGAAAGTGTPAGGNGGSLNIGGIAVLAALLLLLLLLVPFAVGALRRRRRRTRAPAGQGQ